MLKRPKLASEQSWLWLQALERFRITSFQGMFDCLKSSAASELQSLLFRERTQLELSWGRAGLKSAATLPRVATSDPSHFQTSPSQELPAPRPTKPRKRPCQPNQAKPQRRPRQPNQAIHHTSLRQQELPLYQTSSNICSAFYTARWHLLSWRKVTTHQSFRTLHLKAHHDSSNIW